MKSKDCFQPFFLWQQLIFYKFLTHVMCEFGLLLAIRLCLVNLICPLRVVRYPVLHTNQDARLLVTPKLAILDWVRYDCSSAVIGSEYIQRVSPSASASPRHACPLRNGWSRRYSGKHISNAGWGMFSCFDIALNSHHMYICEKRSDVFHPVLRGNITTNYYYSIVC